MSELMSVSIDAEIAAAMTDQEWGDYWASRGAIVRAEAKVLARIEARSRRSKGQLGRKRDAEQHADAG